MPTAAGMTDFRSPALHPFPDGMWDVWPGGKANCGVVFKKLMGVIPVMRLVFTAGLR